MLEYSKVLENYFLNVRNYKFINYFNIFLQNGIIHEIFKFQLIGENVINNCGLFMFTSSRSDFRS